MTEKQETVVVDKDELDELQEADDILKRVESQEELCGKLALEVEDATDVLKSKKANYQAAVLKLRELCRLRKEEHPLFPEPAATQADAWREYTLSHLGIEGKLQAKLEDAEVKTLGQLSGTMNVGGIEWYKGIKGIGVKAAEEISDRFADFWALHPEFCEESDNALLRVSDD
jgi:hypothetical protein